MLLMGKHFPGEVGIAILESWRKGEMFLMGSFQLDIFFDSVSQCQDGRSLPGLLVGQKAGRHLLHSASTAQLAIRLSTQNSEMPNVLWNTLTARSRWSVAI